MNTYESAFNKGVPNGLDVNMTFYDLLSLSRNRKVTADQLVQGLISYCDVISRMIGKSISIYPGNRLVQVNTDLSTLEKYITISPIYLDTVIASNLNVNNYYSKMKRGLNCDTGTAEDAKERLELLKNIKSGSQLAKQFPCLYDALNFAKKIKKDMEKGKKISEQKYQEVIDFYCITPTDLEFFDSFNSTEDFIKHSYEVFSALVQCWDQVKDIYKEVKLDNIVLEGLDLEKLELYLAAFYLDLAEDSNDLSKKQKCLYYVSTYMFENKDKLDDGLSVEKLVTNIDSKATTINISKRMLYEKFKKMLIDNPGLYNINFDNHIFADMSSEEIEKLMAEYMKSIKLKWDILPDDDAFIIEDVIRSSSGGAGRKSGTTNGSRRDPAEVFMEKKAFFDSSDPFIKVVGKDTFDGYVGYIYPNGTVILDKFYENAKTKKLAEDEAIYCMKLDDFYLLSQLSKSTIIAGKLCKRFYHRGDWQSRVQKEITGSPKSEVAYKTKLLELINLLK